MVDADKLISVSNIESIYILVGSQRDSILEFISKNMPRTGQMIEDTVVSSDLFTTNSTKQVLQTNFVNATIVTQFLTKTKPVQVTISPKVSLGLNVVETIKRVTTSWTISELAFSSLDNFIGDNVYFRPKYIPYLDSSNPMELYNLKAWILMYYSVPNKAPINWIHLLNPLAIAIGIISILTMLIIVCWIMFTSSSILIIYIVTVCICSCTLSAPIVSFLYWFYNRNIDTVIFPTYESIETYSIFNNTNEIFCEASIGAAVIICLVLTVTSILIRNKQKRNSALK